MGNHDFNQKHEADIQQTEQAKLLQAMQGSGISVCTKETKENAIRSLSSDLLLPSDLIKS